MKSFDWSFTFVYDDEIHLTPKQEEQFQTCCQLKFKPESQINICDGDIPSFFNKVPDNRQTRFIMFGC